MSFVPTSWQQPVLTAEFDAIGRHPHARGHRAWSPRRRASTRRARARCSARCARPRSARPRRSIRAARTASPRSTGTTSRSTTARATICSPARASCSTTRVPRRGREFVTRKVTEGVARIELGQATELTHREPRRAPRLGLRGRLRGRHVAHAAAARGRRLRGRDRRGALGARAGRDRLRRGRARLAASTCGRIPRCSGPPRSST